MTTRLGNRLAAAAALVLLGAGGSAFASGDIARELPIRIFGMEFNHNTVMMTFVVCVIICLAAWICARGMREIPGKGQALFEMVFSAFDNLVREAIGPRTYRQYLPWIGTLFLFLWLSNLIGLIPVGHGYLGGEDFKDYNHNGRFDPGEYAEEYDTDGDGVHDPGFPTPGWEEPTTDYAVPLAMALLFVLGIGHGGHIRKHGVGGYVKSYFDPGGFMGVVMSPLNVVGKIAEVVSVSFRLFGNIFGGAVIMIVVGGLIHEYVLPIPMALFFIVFAGTVQAFVFTMLALTYISLGVSEEEEE